MAQKTVQLGKRTVGEGHAPYIIAELSGNHNQSIDRALALIDAAAKAKAHAIKLQTYTADTMTIDCDRPEFRINDPKSLWNGNSLYDLYKIAHTPWEWHERLFNRAREHGMDYFSTPFDATAVDFLESLNVPFYKIASFENTDLPLIKKVAQTGKPIIISTGMATISEFSETIETIRRAGNDQIVILKCTSNYPASPADSNIVTIPHLRDLYGAVIGLSDHTLGIGVPVASVAFGSAVIEKHFTLARSDGGPDAAFSMEPHELAALVDETERAFLSLGHVHYGQTEKEKSSLIFRRSIYVVRDMKAGEAFTPDNVRIIRPGMGLAPKHIDLVLGRSASCDIKRGTAVSWELVGK